jgi:dethiobiotin synthetase
MRMSEFEFPKAFFVTGTDTDVGKTMVCAILLKALGGTYWKPVQSGIEEETDTERVRKLTELPPSHFLPETYRLSKPLSPHASAKLDGRHIDMRDFVLPPFDHKPLIVEGAGGVMVPLNEDSLVLDLIEQLHLPTVVVARSGLGTINHTTLTINAIRSRGIAVLGVIMNGERNEGNRQAIEHYAKTKVIVEVPPLTTVSPAAIAQAGELMLRMPLFNRLPT